MATAYLGLGSNLGGRAANLQRALERLDSPTVRILRVSSLYESEPIGVTESPVPDYLNCAVEIETALTPTQLLEWVKNLERELGRSETFRWGPRVIDIDILLYDDVSLDSEELTIPHPRLSGRKFALIPLMELSPHLRLPDGRAVKDLAETIEVTNQALRMLIPDWKLGELIPRT